MRLLSLSEASIQPRTDRLKFGGTGYGSTGARSSAQERHSEICSQVDAETQGPRGIVELLPSFREDDADEQEK